MRIIVDGSLNPEIEDDYRITEAQGQAMLKAARADPEAEIVGMDKEVRPIVRSVAGGASAWSDVALFKNGSATGVIEPRLENWEIELPRNGKEKVA